jgi:hypothetical protein
VAQGHTKWVYFLLMFIPVYKKQVYVDGIHKFIIYYVCCLANQFLTCLGSRHYAWSPMGEESAAHNVPEDTDPQLSYLLYVTLMGYMFGADCLSVFLFSLQCVYHRTLILSLM